MIQKAIQRTFEWLRVAETKLRWLPLALARVTLGGLFMSTGWGKVHHLDKVASFFAELHIPAPMFNATLVAFSELVCGTLLLVGLASRLATIPLVVTMTVALLSAKRDEIHGLPDLFGLVEFTYLVLLVVVAILGPGALSADALLGRVRRRRGGAPGSRAPKPPSAVPAHQH